MDQYTCSITAGVKKCNKQVKSVLLNAKISLLHVLMIYKIKTLCLDIVYAKICITSNNLDILSIACITSNIISF